ncbi:MAG TPA: response regulator [Thermodesulfobacteriota bacterium]|nr:response regulator [Thermodesulfobacteriota bacterium]
MHKIRLNGWEMMRNKEIKVLIVEDEILVAMDIQNRLEMLGYSVTAIASSKEEAIRNIQETKPDLVLLDIKLFGTMDGVAIAEQIHTHFKIPFIYLTAHGDESTLERAKTTAPYGYILKPFEEGVLHPAIQIALYKHGLEREVRARTENSLDEITGMIEFILKEGPKTCDPEILQRVELIRKAAGTINEAIQEL